jgi:hypothetical protein
MLKTAYEAYAKQGNRMDRKEGAQMFAGEWVWAVVAGVGLIVVLTALELLGVAVAAIGETGGTNHRPVHAKRAA